MSILLTISIIIAIIIGGYCIFMLIIAIVPGFSVPEQNLYKSKPPIQKKDFN